MGAPTPEYPQQLPPEAIAAAETAFEATTAYVAALKTVTGARNAASGALALSVGLLYQYELGTGDSFYESARSVPRPLASIFFGQFALASGGDLIPKGVLPEKEDHNHFLLFPRVPAAPNRLLAQRTSPRLAIALSRTAFASGRLTIISLSQGKELVAQGRVLDPTTVVARSKRLRQ